MSMRKKSLHGEMNQGFQPDSGINIINNNNLKMEPYLNNQFPDASAPEVEEGKKRDEWGNGLEFLMSCIAMSVGLGNIWRFPYTAYSNGGGAFLIPYIIVLLVIGKPLYFLEMILGQFSSKGTIKVYDFSPAIRGAGAGQTLAVTCVMTYYASLMAIIIYYMFGSFSAELPWSLCQSDWDDCYPSRNPNLSLITNETKSSSQLYFEKVVLRESDDIENGIGLPEWKLTLCLLMAWISIFLVLLKGVKSSGKASYFLALFPYVIMLVLLVKASTLPGAVDGIVYFIKPEFAKILNAEVWYNAVTQCFFSLSVCFGNVIMYASYNNFRHGIYRDAMIVTTLDTFTSLIAGFTIFGILGNLAKETGRDVREVVDSGMQLAFVSYPDAISKFENVPQLFSFLFFFMLYVLGVGSNVAMASSIITVIRDKFPWVKRWVAVICVAVFGFGIGIVYITPGGQWIVNLVDTHGASFIVFLLGISELAAVSYIYGIGNICDDIEFMLGFKVGIYWRICWVLVTPILLVIIFIFALATLEPLSYKNLPYPTSAVAIGWVLSAFGIMQLPIFMLIAIYKRKEVNGFWNKFKKSFQPLEKWGPVDPKTKREWIAFKESKKQMKRQRAAYTNAFMNFINKVLGY